MKKQFSFFMLLITVCVISAKASNNKKVYITSTMRSARKQAEIMYNQTKNMGLKLNTNYIHPIPSFPMIDLPLFLSSCRL